MLTHHRRPVCLSWMSTDLPLLSTLETAATLYQKDQDCFHLLLNQTEIPHSITETELLTEKPDRQLLWLEISSSRVIMTMQGQGNCAYRHFWEKGVYGISRYWFNGNLEQAQTHRSFRLQNYTRHLHLVGDSLPEYLRVDYELWTGNVHLGHYVVHLEIYH